MSRCHCSISSNDCTSKSLVTDVTTNDFDINPSLALLDDRHQTSENNHIDRACSSMFQFNSDLSNHFANLASIADTTPEYLIFTCYSIFLFKFTGQEQDFHVLQNVTVQHRPQLSYTVEKTTNRYV
jgi:hypothetical protein